MRGLKKIREDLETIEDELRVDYDLTGWANRLRRMHSEMKRKTELEGRIRKLKAGHYDFNTLVKNLTRSREGAKTMRRILAQGGTHYKGKRIMGGKTEPYIQRWSRKEVKAELTFDVRKQIGGGRED